VTVANKTTRRFGASLVLLFHWLSKYLRATVDHEELPENPVFNRGSRDLHSRFRGRHAELCKDG
jgi:hypothetical protein